MLYTKVVLICSKRLIETAYDAGLFTEGTQLLVSAQGVTPDLWQLYMTPGRNDIDKILKGLIGARQHLAYDVHKLPDFVQRWRNQPSTEKCQDNTTDDDGNLLYITLDPTKSYNVCTGYNFPLYFNSDGSNIAPFTVYAYDAVILLAAGLQYLYNNKKPADDLIKLYKTDDLQNALIAVKPNQGFTGPIQIRTGKNYVSYLFKVIYYNTNHFR